MFSSSLIGFLMALGVAAWIYSKMMYRTGNNTQSALVIASLVGIIVFVAVLITVKMIDNSLAQ